MQLPKITVVMPSYNQSDYLECAINSVLSQGYSNLEFIVLDGGSNDDSLAILERYQEYFSFWRSQPDNGQAAALKEGFEMATGDIFCWLNSDDVFLPNALTTVAQAFLTYPKVDFIYSDRNVVDADSQTVGKHKWPFYLLEYHWAFGQPLAQECCFWRSHLYYDVGGLNPDLYFIMDYDLFYRMWKKGRFKKVSQTLACIRVHDQSKNSLAQDVLKQEISSAIRRYKIKQPGYLTIRLLNRFNSLQFLFERLMRRLHIW